MCSVRQCLPVECDAFGKSALKLEFDLLNFLLPGSFRIPSFWRELLLKTALLLSLNFPSQKRRRHECSVQLPYAYIITHSRQNPYNLWMGLVPIRTHFRRLSLGLYRINLVWLQLCQWLGYESIGTVVLRPRRLHRCSIRIRTGTYGQPPESELRLQCCQSHGRGRGHARG